MKTAEETINRIVLTGFDLPDAINLIKDYAKQVAEQALKDASVKAGNFFNDFAGGKKEDVKQARISSILNTEIKTP